MHKAARTAAWVLVLLVTIGCACAWAEDAPAADEQLAEIEALTARLEENPENVDVLIELGNVYYETGMYNEARGAYLEVVRLDSTHVGALTNLGSLHTDMGDFNDAQNTLERAAAIEPDNAMVHTNLGTLHYARRQYQKAVDAYRAALALDPDSVEAHFNLGVAFADAQIFDEAVREWQRVVELDPDGPIGRVSRENIQMIEEFRGNK